MLDKRELFFLSDSSIFDLDELLFLLLLFSFSWFLWIEIGELSKEYFFGECSDFNSILLSISENFLTLKLF